MLIIRLTVTYIFLITLSFLVASSLAHNSPVVRIDSEVGGAFPSRQLCVTDNHSAHGSISASAAESYSDVYNQISQSATCDLSI